jgi:hypothetical protein
MKYEPLDLWCRFSTAFVEEINAASESALYFAWQKHSKRTELYGQDIIPGVASRLGLRNRGEFLRIDWALMKATSGETVPIVFVESENAAGTAGQEMRKLCAVSCPLAVLITVIEWDPNVYPTATQKERLMAEWGRIIRAHYALWPRPGIIAVIVGEWSPENTLSFYSLAYSTTGDIEQGQKTLLQRRMTWPLEASLERSGT